MRPFREGVTVTTLLYADLAERSARLMGLYSLVFFFFSFFFFCTISLFSFFVLDYATGYKGHNTIIRLFFVFSSCLLFKLNGCMYSLNPFHLPPI